MIEFPAPEGLELPQGVKPGETLEMMATLQLGEQGELYLKELDGVAVSPEEDKDNNTEEDQAEESGGFLNAVERRAEEQDMG